MLKRVQHDVKQKQRHPEWVQCHSGCHNVIPNLFRNLRRESEKRICLFYG